MNARRSLSLLPLFLLLLGASLPLWGQADRGIITGIITDQQGATVPDAPVRITNSNTGVVTMVRSSGTGNYTTPPLIIGVYEVRVEMAGFKTFAVTGIRLDSGQTFRQDVRLEVGEVTQTLEVSASGETLNVVNPEVSASVDQKYYQDLPAVVSSEMRLPETLLYTVPGFTSLKPTNSFPAGTQFMSRINGGQRAAFENFLDGASYGEVSGHNQTQERSAPFESIQEMRVIQNTFSAQYGHTSGGFVEYTTKSGTSKLHGVVYEYLQNDALNARGEVAVQKPVLRQNSYGFTLGGPVFIPKAYDGRKKTFFFFNFDQMKYRQQAFNSFITIPTNRFRQGDFSELLGGQAGTDACGRPVRTGQIFDPSTTRDASTCGGPAGVSVRDPFPNNIVPLRSVVGRNVNALFPSTDRAGVLANYRQESPDRFLEPRTILTRIDHNISDNFKLASTFNYNDRPRQTDCGFVGGCSRTTPLAKSFVQRISTKLFHLQATWNIRPNFFTHATGAYDRWAIPGVGDFEDQGWFSKIGLKGIPEGDQGGFPGINFDQRYTALGRPNGRGFAATDRYQFLDDTTYLFGRHTLKFGFEFRRERWAQADRGILAGNWNFSFRNTAAFNASGAPIANTGDPYASMLLGEVSSVNFQVATQPDWRRNYYAPWINDDIKITERLTLSFGFRWDFRQGRVEKYNRYSTFSPTRPNPGADGRPGAIQFAGVDGAPRKFEETDTSALGPRFGFAYRLGEQTVIRGGYGIYYAPVVMNQFSGTPTLGFSSNPTVVDLTNGRQAALNWDDGFPASAIIKPPFINPAVGNGTNVLWVNPDSLTLPRYQNWTLSVQRQLQDNLLLDVAYVANHGTRLIGGNILGSANQNDPAILDRYPVSLLTSNINSPAAQAAGIAKPYPSFNGSVAQALRPFPQFQTVTPYNAHNGQSIYHSMQLKLDKRFSNGLQGRFAWTWSKLLHNGAESGLGGLGSDTRQIVAQPQSVFRQEKGLSVDDVTHSVIMAYTYELPFGRNKRFLNVTGVADHILGGWNVSGIHRYSGGRPLPIVMNNLYSGVLFNTALRPDRVTGVGGFKNNDNSNFDIARDRYLDPAAFAVPSTARLGNAGRVDAVVRGWASYSEDISVFKNFLVREPLSIRIGANLANAFNRHQWCDPNTNFSDTTNFGIVSGQCDVPRRIEVYARISF